MLRISTTVGLEMDGPRALDDIVDEVRDVARRHLAGAWWSQGVSWDALTAIAVAGSAVPDLPVGTAVVPTYPRHPVALASQALSVQAVVGDRLTLGIGPSHRMLIEDALGLVFDRPAVHTREYLEVLLPLLEGEVVDVRGEMYQVSAQVRVGGTRRPSVIVAAMGPAMLRVAGELADGTVTIWAGPRTVTDHVVPTITAAAEGAGRPAPRVIVSLPVAVTEDVDAARAWVAARMDAANHLPSYRAVMEREGVSRVQDVIVAGSEEDVVRHLERLRDGGATEFVAIPFGGPEQVERTLTLLEALAHDARWTAPPSNRDDHPQETAGERRA